jgi:hypothetical protein
MENNNEIIINAKFKKLLTEAQKENQRETMRNYYLKKKADPEYIERQRLSSKTHYYKHKEEVLQRMKKYQRNKLELARIEALHDLQQQRSIDLMTGNISREYYDKLQQKINDKLAHLHLLS